MAQSGLVILHNCLLQFHTVTTCVPSERAKNSPSEENFEDKCLDAITHYTVDSTWIIDLHNDNVGVSMAWARWYKEACRPAFMNRENHYEDLETEGPIEEKSVPIRHSVVCSRERNHDAPQVRVSVCLLSMVYLMLNPRLNPSRDCSYQSLYGFNIYDDIVAMYNKRALLKDNRL